MPTLDHTQRTSLSQNTIALFPPSTPTREVSPLEAEQHKQQTLIEVSLATIEHFFGPPEAWLAGLDDPRDPGKIIYPLPSLLFTGILMFLCHLGARRQVNHKLRDNAPAAANFAQLFGVRTIPHGDTLNHAFARLNPDQAQAKVTDLVETLIRKKVLDRYRLFDRYWVVVIDGTGLYTFHERHCKHCLTRTNADGKTLYYHNVLEAKLVTYDGFAFSLMSEFIENPGHHPTKQDCELKAFYRLAGRLKRRFPRLPICLAMDGLFAGGPTFQTCADSDWRYVIVLKDGNLPSVHQEFAALAPLQPDQRLKVQSIKPARIRQAFCWVNRIAYRDTQGRDHQVNVLECQETESDKDDTPQTTRFVWITDFTLTKNNLRAVAQNAGRIRWKIENEGFNSQKRGGFELEHAYSQNQTSAKVFYFLLQIAHLFYQLIVAGSLLKKYFPRGFGSLKNFAFRLLEAWRNSLLSTPALALIRQLRCQIRLDTS